MFSYVSQNNLLSKSQSGFKPGDSCVNQLLAITHGICSSFGNNHEFRAVFLDIVYKLKRNGISRSMLKLLTNFLKNRKQSIFNG